MIKKKDPDTDFRARQIGELTMIPMYLAGGPLIGYWMGTWLDHKFGTGPYVRAGLMILGLIAAGREAWRIIREMASSGESSK